jgi:hypothetical protein
MNYSSLEEVYGKPFGQRVPVTSTASKTFDKPVAAEFSSLADKSAASIKKNQSVIDDLKKSLPLDTDPVTESFRVESPRMAVREKFASSQPANIVTDFDQTEKLSRILRLVEQNRTGYERPATQDMVLYIATGIFFLFTFDTFVMLGKSMRGK